MGDDLKTLQMSGEADINLVVSAVGLWAAKVLWEKYHIPYVIGTPNQWLAEDISRALEHTVTQKTDSVTVYLQNRMQQEAEIALIGEPVTMGSLAAGIEKQYGRATRVLCPLKECDTLLGQKGRGDARRRSHGRGTEKCQNHCGGSTVSPDLSKRQHFL